MKTRMRVAMLAVLLLAVSAAAVDNTVVEQTSKAKEHLLTLFLKGGRPKNEDSTRPVTVLINQAYVVGYSEDRKNPLWSAYHVDQVTAKEGSTTVDLRINHDRPDNFHTDTRTTSQVDGSQTFPGYDRGHMTPNNAIQFEYGRLAQMETFFMSNMCPQVDSLNRGLWQRLEHAITKDLVDKWDDIWVIAGPIFGPNPATVGASGVQVPDSCYMILLEQYYDRGEHGVRHDVIAFQLPNDAAALQGKSLEDFVTEVDDIETLTSLDFFPELVDQDTIEAAEGDYQVWFGTD